jgi:hypothetical protein
MIIQKKNLFHCKKFILLIGYGYDIDIFLFYFFVKLLKFLMLSIIFFLVFVVNNFFVKLLKFLIYDHDLIEKFFTTNTKKKK